MRLEYFEYLATLSRHASMSAASRASCDAAGTERGDRAAGA